MIIAVACDQLGFNLKEEVKLLLQSQGHQVIDFSADKQQASHLPGYVYPAAIAVSKGKADRGIFIDSVGFNSALIANKITGLFAAACQDTLCAQLSRSQSNTNILCIGSQLIGLEIAKEIVNTWMTTEFRCDEEEYKNNMETVVRISENHLKPLFRCEIDKQERYIDQVMTESLA
ncbi:RpiB/LacA/LacB family sugar-phosphate isomerase [Psychromonas sp. PT13]|uniref:RpiB/LacA/LacB family sugar-phosphate isomerase n=1 Tax=Psychromonas sp. PT13 TaxID=3439547 RepID=UPI003EBE3B2C